MWPCAASNVGEDKFSIAGRAAGASCLGEADLGPGCTGKKQWLRPEKMVLSEYGSYRDTTDS